MTLVKWAFIGLVALPLAEIAVFLVLAALIGWFWTASLLVATSVLGVALLRHSGRRELAALSDALTTHGLRGLSRDGRGFARLLGTFLLILPGFITDVVGAALFIPSVPRWAARTIARMRPKPRPPDGVIDLEPGEWRRLREKKPRRSRSSRHA